jgi:hypothetical protein
VEQENISRIEEEVNRSLAKAMSSTVNNSKKRCSPYVANRSYQSLTNQASTTSFYHPQKDILNDITQNVNRSYENN